MSASTLLFQNATILIRESSFAAQLSELTVNYKAEMLDRTAFNMASRERRGGLFMADVAAKGFLPNPVTGGLGELLFGEVGLTDLPLVVFPDTIVEGSQTARGFAMLSVLEHFNIGGQVGALMTLDLAANSAGLF